MSKLISARMACVLAMATIITILPASAKPSPGLHGASTKEACIKRQIAKGRSQCLAKAQCDGVTSRKEQARICG